jgi:Hg(II)-responsive transcriptional regulator
MLAGMRTSEVAAGAAVNAQTLRYYERRGLLPEPGRSASGYRMYPPEAVRRVRFIRRAQELGFTLADVETLLHLAEGGPDSCDGVRAVASRKVADLDARIADLHALRDGLTRLAATCERPRAERECPILHELDPVSDLGVPAASKTARDSERRRP